MHFDAGPGLVSREADVADHAAARYRDVVIVEVPTQRDEAGLDDDLVHTLDTGSPLHGAGEPARVDADGNAHPPRVDIGIGERRERRALVRLDIDVRDYDRAGLDRCQRTLWNVV